MLDAENIERIHGLMGEILRKSSARGGTSLYRGETGVLRHCVDRTVPRIP